MGWQPSVRGSVLIRTAFALRHLSSRAGPCVASRRHRPIAGDTVWIQKGKTLMLDYSPPKMYFILIEGTLIFDRVDIELNCSYMFVAHGGKLTVGTELEPFLQRAVITLHGNPVSQELPTYGAKLIGCRGCVLDLHGIPYMRSWTRLEQPALVRGKSVLEFGTGIGLLAISAALAGAARVSATDIEPAALAFVQQSAADNGVSSRVVTATWDWHEPPPAAAVGSHAPFDVVLLPDVLYDESAVVRLGELAPTLVKSPGGLLLFADGTDRPYQTEHSDDLTTSICALGAFEQVSCVAVRAGLAQSETAAAAARLEMQLGDAQRAIEEMESASRMREMEFDRRVTELRLEHGRREAALLSLSERAAAAEEERERTAGAAGAGDDSRRRRVDVDAIVADAEATKRRNEELRVAVSLLERERVELESAGRALEDKLERSSREAQTLRERVARLATSRANARETVCRYDAETETARDDDGAFTEAHDDAHDDETGSLAPEDDAADDDDASYWQTVPDARGRSLPEPPRLPATPVGVARPGASRRLSTSSDVFGVDASDERARAFAFAGGDAGETIDRASAGSIRKAGVA